MDSLLNSTSPLALHYRQQPAQLQPVNLGTLLPPGVLSVRDLAPAEIKHLVHEHWNDYPAADPRVHYLLGTAYFFLGLAAVTGNALVLYIFGKYRSLRSPTNTLMMNLAFCDLMLFFGLYPELIGNCFFNDGLWMWGDLACKIHSFCGLVFGFGQMQTLTYITWDRYNVIVKGLSAPPLTYQRVVRWLAQIWFVSLFWSLAPFFGFGAMSVDGILNTCSFDYFSRDAVTQTYIIGACVSAYVIPVLVICFAYWKIVRAVWVHEEQLRFQAQKMNVASLRTNANEANSNNEWRIAKVALTNISLWLFAWTPFTVVSFIGVLGNQSLINPYVSSLPVLLAKTSSVYNPIVYAISHPKYQQCLKEELSWLCIDNKEKALSTKAETTEKSESVSLSA